MKACGTVDHKMVLKKLEHNGIRGMALQWFQNQLSDRQQFGYFGNEESHRKNITCRYPKVQCWDRYYLLYI